ncbi:DedA family protein [Ornithinimicrobium avium]|uniref:DedA family protein n=1 Tax=Ornithinimicrobium avium TaxID=2283195 RepID=A0A345NL38_9MICO|nr:DedA family protein [Ornithinimicrobium avium]AXH95746.1 DedA family protein [Ornithinimicrobium avium]
MLEALNAFIEANADSAWLLPIVLLLCILDGVLPPVPSEATLVALGAVAGAEGDPNIAALIAVAALGSFLGDNLTYTIGRHTRLGRLRDSKRPKVRGFVNWVVKMLDRRGGTIVIACRYVPGGRQLVNLTAGATEFPRPRFMLFDGIGVTTWSAYNVGVGALAGSWLEEQPLLGLVIAIVLALVLGWFAELGAKRWRSRTERRVGVAS